MTTADHFHFSLPGETWRPTHVDGYFVSDLGRLASARRYGGGVDMDRSRLLSVKPGAGGYVRGSLAGDSHYVHRLVAAAFLGQAPTTAHEIAFADGDLGNCRLDNLSWMTPQAKHRAQRAAGKWDASSRVGTAKMTEGTVRALRLDMAEGLSPTQAAAKYAISKVTVHHIKAGRTWSHVA